MENNGFFGTMLRTLGFEVCSVGARVNEAGASGKSGEEFHGWWVSFVIVLSEILEGGDD